MEAPFPSNEELIAYILTDTKHRPISALIAQFEDVAEHYERLKALKEASRGFFNELEEKPEKVLKHFPSHQLIVAHCMDTSLHQEKMEFLRKNFKSIDQKCERASKKFHQMMMKKSNLTERGLSSLIAKIRSIVSLLLLVLALVVLAVWSYQHFNRPSNHLYAGYSTSTGIPEGTIEELCRLNQDGKNPKELWEYMRKLDEKYPQVELLLYVSHFTKADQDSLDCNVEVLKLGVHKICQDYQNQQETVQ